MKSASLAKKAGKSEGVTCKKCGKHYGKDGRAFEKHAEECTGASTEGAAKSGGVTCTNCGKHYGKDGVAFEKHQAECTGEKEKVSKKDVESESESEGPDEK